MGTNLAGELECDADCAETVHALEFDCAVVVCFGCRGIARLNLQAVTGFTPFIPILNSLMVEGPPSGVQVVRKLVGQPGWKDDLLFAVLGFLLACSVIWLLEEMRTYQHHRHQP